MLLRTERPLPALDNPIPTATKRLAKWQKQVDFGNLHRRKTRNVVVPGLDVAALSRKYGMEEATKPRLVEGTFTVPIGISPSAYHAIRNDAIKRFIEAMDKQGWEFVPIYRIKVYPGMYPAVDLRDGIPLLDMREMRVHAHFRFRKPEPVKIEIDKRLTEARTVKA